MLIADVHLGRDAFGVSGEKWSAPLREAVDIASDHGAQAIVSAGDLFHSRNPTQEAFAQFSDALSGNTFSDIEGNHTKGQARHDLPAAEVLNRHGNPDYDDWSFVTSGVERRDGLVLLPWPRPCDYLDADEIYMRPIPDQIVLTRQRVMESLRMACDRATGPVLLTGHAMMSYGAGEPPMLGKDVVLRYEDLLALPNVAQVEMGHVHDPGQPGYIGSTQPTDWSEAGQVKSCVLVTFSDGKITTTRIPYKSSLRLKLVDLPFYGPGTPSWVPLLPQVSDGIDVLRVRVQVHEGSVDASRIAASVVNLAHRVLPIEVIPERKVTSRVAASKPLGELPAADAVNLWLQLRKTDPALAGRAREAFAGLLPQ